MDVTGPVVARGTCTGTIVSNPLKSCNAASDPDGVDPAYAQPTTGLTYRVPPASCSTPLTTLSPGYYDDVEALKVLTNGAGTCSGTKTLNFLPGTYYFDFHNGSAGVGGTSGTGHIWTINSANLAIVGGTLTPGWNTATRPALPGTCVSPLTSTSAAGVKFVFGGDSRISVTAGYVELCGTYSATSPPVTIYGATSGADTAATATTKVASTTLSGGGSYRFTGSPSVTSAITNTDGTVATSVISTNNKTATTSLTATGFASSTLPLGAILTGAEVRITHRETFSKSGNTVVATVQQGTTTLATQSLALSGTMTTATIPVPLSTFTTGVHNSGAFPTLNVVTDVDAVARETLTTRIDSVQLVLTYNPPAVRSQTTAGSCVGTAPYVSPSTNCALITTSGASTGFYVAGTTYVPKAALHITLTGARDQVFKSGVIARSLRLAITPTGSYTGPLIGVPDVATTLLEVFFKAYSCPEGSTCSAAAPAAPWRLAGTAWARYVDPSGTPVAGSREVTVVSWNPRG